MKNKIIPLFASVFAISLLAISTSFAGWDQLPPEEQTSTPAPAPTDDIQGLIQTVVHKTTTITPIPAQTEEEQISRPSNIYTLNSAEDRSKVIQIVLSPESTKEVIPAEDDSVGTYKVTTTTTKTTINPTLLGSAGITSIVADSGTLPENVATSSDMQGQMSVPDATATQAILVNTAANVDTTSDTTNVVASKTISKDELQKNSKIMEGLDGKNTVALNQKYTIKKYKPVYNVTRYAHDSKAITNVSTATLSKIKDLGKYYLTCVGSAQQLNANMQDPDIKKAFQPIEEAYKNLLEASSACCASKFSDDMSRNNVSYRQRLDFTLGDYNTNEMQNFCMFYNDKDINYLSTSSSNAQEIYDVKQSCVCQNKEYIENELKIFDKLDKVMAGDKLDIIYPYKAPTGNRKDINIMVQINSLRDSLKDCK